MAWTKSFLLREGDVEYISYTFDLYFVKFDNVYLRKGIPTSRIHYFTFGRGRCRGRKMAIKRLSYEEYKKKMNMCKTMDRSEKEIK